MAAKLAVDTGSQIFNPFLPLIASGPGLSVVELGRLIGLRNVMGIFSPLSGALSDRFGYRLVIRVSLLLIAAGNLLLAVSSAPWMVAVTIIAIARMCFEFNIVSHFPLLSEQVPQQRGQVMTLGAAATMLGATLAGFTGPWLFVTVGVAALAWTSAAAVAAGLAIVALFVRER
jgi:MFS family permease